MFYISKDMKPNHEFAFDTILFSMNRGIRIDKNKINEVVNNLNKDCTAAAEELATYHGIMNPNSAIQVKNAFMNELDEDDLCHCKVMGKITFKKEVLEKLSELGYTLADLMLKYRKAKKTIENLLTLVEYADEDDLIHPLVNRGATNRFNYSKPALMNIPKSLLWDVIVPYDEGNSLYSVDIHQQEPWIIVNMLEIDELKGLLAVHKDFYKALYYAAFGEECTDEQRKEVKRAWNAMSYGASEPGVCGYCTLFDGKVLYKYFNSIKQYKEYKGRAFGLAKKGVHRVKTYFGTELYAEEQGNKLQRVLMNIPIQGTGSDILSFLIERFYDMVSEDGYGDLMNIYYTRHDELIIEVSDKCTEESVANYLKRIFIHQIDEWEPFQVEVEKVSGNTEKCDYDTDGDVE